MKTKTNPFDFKVGEHVKPIPGRSSSNGWMLKRMPPAVIKKIYADSYSPKFYMEIKFLKHNAKDFNSSYYKDRVISVYADAFQPVFVDDAYEIY